VEAAAVALLVLTVQAAMAVTVFLTLLLEAPQAAAVAVTGAVRLAVTVLWELEEQAGITHLEPAAVRLTPQVLSAEAVEVELTPLVKLVVLVLIFLTPLVAVEVLEVHRDQLLQVL
jgi:hypothetical protein